MARSLRRRAPPEPIRYELDADAGPLVQAKVVPMIARGSLISVLFLLGSLGRPFFVVAGQSTEGEPAAGSALPRASTAAPAPDPIPPETVSRTPEGAVTVRAVRLPEPLRLDGRLDERVYREVPAISVFIQQLPTEGAPATERTEAWVMFDGDNMYVSARCWDSAPPEQWIANEMRRDRLIQQDNFAVIFDTFHDRRNAFYFYTNPLGALADYTITDEGNLNRNWNAVWEVRTGRFEGGWTVEMAIPFKSLRYTSGPSQTWGIQLRRAIRRKSESTYLTQIPASLGGGGGSQRISEAATLIGLDLPAASKNLELKPYAISSLTTDRVRTPALSNDLAADFGGDIKYGVTANLTADFTYNTDFAQVEVDEQQVNLTRFSLFFPEKREFFLEGSGVMDFGRGGVRGGGGATPSLFHSRRIGLARRGSASFVVPIEVGGRLTGKAGRFGVGAMAIRTDRDSLSGMPATTFTVMRVKRDVLRRSSIGAMFTNRSASTVADGSNQAYGVDAAFSFFQYVSMGAYFARTKTPGLEDDDTSYQARFDYGADRYGLRLEQLHVGDNFNPEVGFVRRDDFNRTFGSVRFSPRPKAQKLVRKYTWEASAEYILNGAGSIESSQVTGRFNTEFTNSDQVTFSAQKEYELLVRPATITGARISEGRYRFSSAQASYLFGQQRRVSGTLSLQRGQFYDGTITALGYTGGRVSVTTQLSVEPTVSFNRIELPAGSFTTELFRARTYYTFSPRMIAGALLQYSSTDHALSSNLRFRWEYRPGSEFFLVYTDEHDTLGADSPVLKNRAFVIKINRLLRF